MNQAKKGLEVRLKNFILRKNNKKTTKEIENIYKDRLIHELDIINSMNYSSYFLIVSDYIRWAKKFYSSWTWKRIWSWFSSCVLFRYH